MITRRRALQSLAAAPALAGTAAAAATAHALSFEPVAKDVDAMYRAARSCGPENAYHTQLLADVDALLAGRALPDADREAIVADLRCPLCGCRATDV